MCVRVLTGGCDGVVNYQVVNRWACLYAVEQTLRKTPWVDRASAAMTERMEKEIPSLDVLDQGREEGWSLLVAVLLCMKQSLTRLVQCQ